VGGVFVYVILLPASRTDSPKPVRNKLQHAPSTCSFNCLLSYPPSPPRPAPNDSAGGPLMSSVAHYCVQSLHDSEHRERERKRENIFYFHLLPPFETVGWNGISLVSFQPLLSPFTSLLSLSLSPLGFEGLGNSFLVFGKNNNNKIWRVR